jgi:hypothetical protein
MRLKFSGIATVAAVALFALWSVIWVKGRVSVARTRSELSWMMICLDRLYSASNGLVHSGATLHESIHCLDGRIDYRRRRLSDSWGNPYRIVVSTNSADVEVRISSNGPDGLPSTADDLDLEFKLR